MSAEQLKPNFEPFGKIEEVTIIYDRVTHMSKGAPSPSRARRATTALSRRPSSTDPSPTGARLRMPTPLGQEFFICGAPLPRAPPDRVRLRHLLD